MVEEPPSMQSSLGLFRESDWFLGEVLGNSIVAGWCFGTL